MQDSVTARYQLLVALPGLACLALLSLALPGLALPGLALPGLELPGLTFPGLAWPLAVALRRPLYEILVARLQRRLEPVTAARRRPAPAVMRWINPTSAKTRAQSGTTITMDICTESIRDSICNPSATR